MKKALSLFLAIFLLLSFASCAAPAFDSSSASAGQQDGARALGMIDDDPQTVQRGMIDGATAESSLPALYDNSAAYPTPGDQGKEGSCTAWAVAYALKSQQDKKDHGWQYTNDTVFSPSYVYNQINGGKDNGSSILDAMELLTKQGVCPLSEMPYKADQYTLQPNTEQKQSAYPHRAKSWHTVSGTNEIKSAIIMYGGVVVGIPCYPDLDALSSSNPVYDSTEGQSRGNHAICLVGYDDARQAFQFINSWGPDWGLNGFGYVSYKIAAMRGYACVMEDEPERDAPVTVLFNAYGGTGNMDSFILKAGEELVFPQNTFVNGSRKFLGWHVYSKLTNGWLWWNQAEDKFAFFPYKQGPSGWDGVARIAETASVKGITSAPGDTLILCATWEDAEEQYTVGFDANGGVGSMDAIKTEREQPLQIPCNSFKKDGSDFSGWVLKNETTGKWAYLDPVSEDIYYYALNEQPEGYTAYNYPDGVSFSAGLTCNNKDVFTFYAVWQPR